jgi:hypothetical protein
MLKTSVTIAAVTLALVTAAVVVGIVNMMPIQYAKAANGDHCVGSGGSVACSGSGVHAVVVSLLQTSSVSQEGYQGGQVQLALTQRAYMVPVHLVAEAYQPISPAQVPAQVRVAHNLKQYCKHYHQSNPLSCEAVEQYCMIFPG